ncbi:MAG: leucyl aminopeptidase family protein [Myxococcota bacterium]
MPAAITLAPHPQAIHQHDTLLIIGRKARLLEPDVMGLLPSRMPHATWQSMLKRCDPGDWGRVVSTWTGDTPARVAAGVLPEGISRHNSPARAFAIPGLVANAGQKGNVGLVLALEHPNHDVASAIAVARALPTFTATSRRVSREVTLWLQPRNGSINTEAVRQGIEAVRYAAHLTDQPPNRLGCDAFVAEARAVADDLGCDITVLRRPELKEQGMNGILAVGQAAEQSPALVVLDHVPSEPRKAVAWVGKGIVYDTGGLSIKSKTGMPGMKTDMAGAAAVLAGFRAAVRLGTQDRLSAVLCIAENAVGSLAVRPDDIIEMGSGRTVEINNTDAEGRLVLADGVAWVTKRRRPQVLVDMATLTGAQSAATGKRHAALYCSDEALERRVVEAGRWSGDLVHPLPYAPELFRKEFHSTVADMRNSVKDRANAQSSCAGQFIGNHLFASGFDGAWCHIDMAGPSVHAHRGTGFGVGLLMALAS